VLSLADKGARILIIDDENQIRRMLKVALEAHNFEIAEAVNGQDGLNQAATYHPDLIILDLGLPDIDGIEVIQRLREWSQIPVLILSVREQENDKSKLLIMELMITLPNLSTWGNYWPGSE
jgi:two-component system, OmpR family, KDP operon response regulator KdpE